MRAKYSITFQLARATLISTFSQSVDCDHPKGEKMSNPTSGSFQGENVFGPSGGGGAYFCAQADGNAVVYDSSFSSRHSCLVITNTTWQIKRPLELNSGGLRQIVNLRNFLFARSDRIMQ